MFKYMIRRVSYRKINHMNNNSLVKASVKSKYILFEGFPERGEPNVHLYNVYCALLVSIDWRLPAKEEYPTVLQY